jgi:glutathione S-transferase
MMQREQESRFGPAPSGELRLFREPLSGHCHRVELFIRVLGLKCEMIDIDVQKGEAQSTAFRRLNGLMEVPVLWHGNRLLADSSAILCYLALRFDGRGRWLPRDPYEMSQVQRWLSIAAGELLNGPVTARRIKLFGLPFDEARALRESCVYFASWMNTCKADHIWLGCRLRSQTSHFTRIRLMPRKAASVLIHTRTSAAG